MWREVGGFITITCRPRVPDQDFLNIKLGLLSKDDILSTGKNMEAIISKEFRDRLDFNVVFPNVSITIKNLTVNDTGAYWCTYIKTAKKTVEENGSGSVVLVVQGEPITCLTPDASPVNSCSNHGLVMIPCTSSSVF